MPTTPVLRCYLALTLVLAAMTVPTLLYGIVPPAGRWVLVPLIISIAGALAAVVTVSGPRIYPPEVRTSGERPRLGAPAGPGPRSCAWRLPYRALAGTQSAG